MTTSNYKINFVEAILLVFSVLMLSACCTADCDCKSSQIGKHTTFMGNFKEDSFWQSRFPGLDLDSLPDLSTSLTWYDSWSHAIDTIKDLTIVVRDKSKGISSSNLYLYSELLPFHSARNNPDYPYIMLYPNQSKDTFLFIYRDGSGDVCVPRPIELLHAYRNGKNGSSENSGIYFD